MDALEEELNRKNFPKAKLVANEAWRALEKKLDIALDQFEMYTARNVLNFDEAAVRRGEFSLASLEGLSKERAVDQQLDAVTARLHSAKRLRQEMEQVLCDLQAEQAQLEQLGQIAAPKDEVDLAPLWQMAAKAVHDIKRVKQ